MPTDLLILGGIVFDDFSTPERMMGGGNQAMVVHKLPGGSRVIDTLGPDEADVAWQGKFYGNTAYSVALALDAMRAAGQVVELTWGGQFRSVIVSRFIYEARRMPAYLEYHIVCTVTQNPALGSLAAISPDATSIDTLVGTDLNFAQDLADGISPV